MPPQVIQKGRVEGLYLKPMHQEDSLAVTGLQVEVGYGIRGDTHAGTRLSGVRETILRQIGVGKEVPMANVRQISAISCEELAEISGRMLPDGTQVDPALLDPNVVVSGITGFTQLPPGSLLTFGGRKAVLAVWAENEPCKYPHDKIVAALGAGVQFKSGFAQAGRGKRGIVGFVYCGGRIKVGDEVSVWQ